MELVFNTYKKLTQGIYIKIYYILLFLFSYLIYFPLTKFNIRLKISGSPKILTFNAQKQNKTIKYTVNLIYTGKINYLKNENSIEVCFL